MAASCSDSRPSLRIFFPQNFFWLFPVFSQDNSYSPRKWVAEEHRRWGGGGKRKKKSFTITYEPYFFPWGVDYRVRSINNEPSVIQSPHIWKGWRRKNGFQTKNSAVSRTLHRNGLYIIKQRTGLITGQILEQILTHDVTPSSHTSL